jgi:hypothetical protein
MSETETSTKGIRAPALRYEHPYPARPHRRKSAGRIGSQAREALDAAPHERRRETDWAVNRPERCVFSLFFSCLFPPSFKFALQTNTLIEMITDNVIFLNFN